MNLQSQITEVRRRISEPVASDSEDNQTKDDEIIDWLYQSELRLLHELSPEAISRVLPSAVRDEPIVAGTDYVELPTAPATVRPLAVSISQGAGLKEKPCRIVEFKDYQRAHYDPNWRTNSNNPIAAFMGGRIYIWPVRPVAGTVHLRHVIFPTRRYRRFSGRVTTVTDNDHWLDTTAAARGWSDFYFSATSGFTGDQLKYTSGAVNGVIRDVLSYTGATGAFILQSVNWPQSNDVFQPTVVAGATYEVGQTSLLSEVTDLALYAYVEYLCYKKDREEMAQKSLDDYQRELQRINNAYSFEMQGGRS